MSQPTTIPIATAPAIPGLTFRRFRGEADYPEMLRVREGCRERDQIDFHASCAGIPTRDELARSLADTPAGTPNMVMAEIAGRIVGYNRVASRTAEDGRGERSLYESVGFRGLKEHVLYRKPMERAGLSHA